MIKDKETKCERGEGQLPPCDDLVEQQSGSVL